MTERPIIFSGEMVRAILDGRKTQTRRVIRGAHGAASIYAGNRDGLWVVQRFGDAAHAMIRCPYGVTGDRLWVRETCGLSGRGLVYRADTESHINHWIPVGIGPADVDPPGAHRVRHHHPGRQEDDQVSLTYGSVCSGIEAATVAWHPLGWRPAWFAEIDPFCCAVLSHHYPTVTNYGDFTQIGPDAGPIDILVGGTPCQSFSVAGSRKGLDDARGNLTLEFLRLAGRLRPRWLVWENVPGVLSIDGGRTFGTVLGALAQLGYCCAWRVLDAQFFGVPQRRRRVFVVGYLGAWQAAAAVLFERESLCRDTPPRRKAREEVPGSLGGGTGERGWCNDLDRSGAFVPVSLNAKGGCGRLDGESETFVAHTLRDDGYNADEDGTGRGVPILPIPILEPGARRGALDDRDGIGVGEPGDPMYTLGAKHPHAVAFSCKDYGADATEPVVFESRFVRNGRGAPCTVVPPLKAQSGASGRGDGAPLVATWVAVRRLTPRECERLQGFPDDYTLIPNYRRKLRAGEAEEIAAYLGIPVEEARELGATPDGPRYKAIGNSMAVPVMRWIGERIAAVDAISHGASDAPASDGDRAMSI